MTKVFFKNIVDTDLIDIFSALNADEMRDLYRFVRSPYFNQREDVVLLFDYLRRVIDKKSKAKFLDKELVFSEVYGNETFDEKKLHYLLSFLLKIIYKYFVINNLDEIESQARLCSVLRQKHVEKNFHKELKKSHDLLDNQPLRNAYYHEQKAFLHHEYYEINATQKREGDVKLQELSDELSYVSCINTLRQAWLMLSHQQVVKKDYQLPLVNEILQYVESHDFNDKPEIKIYYYLYKMLAFSNEQKSYKAAYDLLLTHWQQFSPTELRSISLSVINYCSKAMRNDVAFRKEGLNIYKFALERDVLTENQVLPPYTYRNIVTLAVGVKDFDWVYEFIHNYKNKLPHEKQETFFTYCLANYHFRTKDFDQAQLLLRQVELKDTLLNFDAKRLLLMMYYENQSFDALDALLTSFKSLVQHNTEVSEQHKMLNINLISMVKKMLHFNLADKHIKEQLVTEINNTSVIAEKEWLLQQFQKRY